MEEGVAASFIQDHLGLMLESVKREIEKKLDGVQEEVVMLRESNIQLIHLISPGVSAPIAAPGPVLADKKSGSADGRPFQNLAGQHSKTRDTVNTRSELVVSLEHPGTKVVSQASTRQRARDSQMPASKVLRNDAENRLLKDSTGDKSDLATDADGFTKAKSRRGRLHSGKSKFDTKYATGDSGKSNKISGAVRRKWVYVGRVAGKDVSAEDIKEYMQDLSNEMGFADITVTKLNTQGSNSAFSIGLPNDGLYERVFDVGYWPKGVALREFNLQRTFLQQRRQQMQS